LPLSLLKRNFLSLSKSLQERLSFLSYRGVRELNSTKYLNIGEAENSMKSKLGSFKKKSCFLSRPLKNAEIYRETDSLKAHFNN
jgi:hypothetical protein